eukprot:TRINITY_DN6256_c0_g1_i1.p2 TRINITY_DN6256_c0_g1~~TRINITY_DN6256_c0_g1_i1.p2  ORF type:complete len:111 (-),score=32.64 TRINITY_DN6256_c0_g1_i1:99-431(-)
MERDFNAMTEDGSIEEISRLLCDLHAQILVDNRTIYDAVTKVQGSGAQSSQKQRQAAERAAREAEHQEAMEEAPETDQTDRNEEMEVEAEQKPTVDEDGWETVTKRKGRK